MRDISAEGGNNAVGLRSLSASGLAPAATGVPAAGWGGGRGGKYICSMAGRQPAAANCGQWSASGFQIPVPDSALDLLRSLLNSWWLVSSRAFVRSGGSSPDFVF